jgi:MFS family permease
LLCVAVFVGGGLTAVYGASSSIPLSLAILALSGAVGPAIFINFGVALIQENVERNMMGRVMSMWGLAFTISCALGYLQAGLISNAFGPQATIIYGGSVACAIGLLALLFFRPVTRLA